MTNIFVQVLQNVLFRYQYRNQVSPKYRYQKKYDTLGFLLSLLSALRRVFLSCFHTVARERQCPANWLRFESSCYFVSSQSANFDSSRRDCDVFVSTVHLQAFLTGFAGAVWIGMTDRNAEGTWVWLDGTLVNKSE
uniref:C-type lectin domain-containing protein n=1 Tax=Neogobius melanostomus TaxID=47308 RepID=A0A8C6UGU7_9GOBI